MTCSPWSDNPLGRTLICTSATRPTGAARYPGLVIYETNTFRYWSWNGTAWVLIGGPLPRVSVFKAAAQTFSTGFNTLNFDSENYDTDGFHDTSTNTNRLTIPTGLAGVYLVSVYVSASIASTSTDAYVQVNNAGKRYIDMNGVGGVFIGSTPIPMAAGEFVDITAYNGTGGAGTITTNVNCAFSLAYMGAT